MTFDLRLSDFSEVLRGNTYPANDSTGEHAFKIRFFLNGHKYGHARLIPAELDPDLIVEAVKRVATEAGTIVQWTRISDPRDPHRPDLTQWEAVHPWAGWPRKVYHR